ncbi:A24 family peptidase [Candidatus Bathyarchaeota archaeon]|nr:A24 family peptidase [Candidatus Bathyarchaeota archaeon]
METLFVAARITVSLGFLLYASWSDYKTREVSNRVWTIYAPIALTLSLFQFGLYEPAKLPFFGLSFGITAVVAVLLFYTGGFGGADSKALMCIALALPFSTGSVFHTLSPLGESPLAQNLFPLAIFSNGVLFAAATAVYLLLYNIVWHERAGKKFFAGTLTKESIGKKLLVMITGHKVLLEKMKATWHVYPMEDVQDENGENPPKRYLLVVPKDEGRDEIVHRLSKAADSGKIEHHVWATPGLPMLIFITFGLVSSLLFGDVVWILISAILR